MNAINYQDYTNEEISFVTSASVIFNCEKARRMFNERFHRDAPPARTILNWKNRLNETLSILPREQSRDHANQRISGDKREEIISAFGDSSTTSQRKVATAAGVSVSTVNKVLKCEGIKPWKFKVVQELKISDYEKRKFFAEFILQKQRTDSNFARNIVFSDEATFHINGAVNRHNTFIYSSENPHAILEHRMKSKSITCWAAVSQRFGIRFRIIDSTMNGQQYLDVLQNIIFPLLKERPHRNLIYQQDGAPAHFSNIVKDALNENLKGRWIGRGSEMEWPPRSPDLSGHVRNTLYQHPVPNDIPELKNKLTNILENIQPDDVVAPARSFLNRCELCFQGEGRQFEQFL